MLDLKRREIQLEAGKHWEDAGCIGTIELITGGGKTFIAFDAIIKLPKGSKVLFLAETNQRELDVLKDAKAYKEFFNINPLEHIDFEFACYQSAYKWKNKYWTLVCNDEIHDSLSEEYFKFYQNNKYEKILGLSATLESSRIYNINGVETTKKEMLNSVAPICYSYGVLEGQRDGTSRKLDIHIIYHKLDGVTRSIEGGNKKKLFMTTEKMQYQYLDNLFWEGVNSKKSHITRYAMSKRAKLLYSLPSKINVVKQLLTCLKGKTIIFNNDLDALELITPNVVRSAKKDQTTKERNIINKQLRESFDNGNINILGSFKVLQQGANLKGVDNEIIMSFYSNSGKMLQRINIYLSSLNAFNSGKS